MDMFHGVEKRQFEPEEGVQHLESVAFGCGEKKDPESLVHTDIFFSTHKAWLYMEDVTLEKGPLTFFKTSHLMNSKRLGYEYRNTIGCNERSRRISNEEISDLGLEETKAIVKKNTLVMANVHGFHRRIPGNPGQVRKALIVGYRFNPFVPQFILKIRRARRGRQAEATV